eukprot:5684089-Amphidinium_carterae.1
MQRSDSSSCQQPIVQPSAVALDVVSIDDRNLGQQSGRPHANDWQFPQCSSRCPGAIPDLPRNSHSPRNVAPPTEA